MPRNVTVTLSDGSQVVYRNVPDNVKPEQIEQRAAKEHAGKRVVSISGDKKPGRIASATKGALSGAANVLFKPFELAAEGLEYLGVPGAAEVRARAEQGKAGAEQSLRPYEEANPNWFAGGKIVGEAVATAPFISAGGAGVVKLGGKLAPLAPKVAKAVQATGRAIQSGGIGVKGKTAAGRTALRVAGGATAGATSAAMADQDVVDAALAGAVIPVAGNIAKHGIGWTYDLLSRRLGKVRAAEILRNLIKDKGDEIAAALRSAPEKVRMNTAQWLAKQGLMTDELAAATQIVGGSKAGKPLREVAKLRGEAIEEGRAALRGGTTQTAGMGGLEAGRKGVTAGTAGMREQALSAADVGRTQIVPLERQAAGLRQGVASEVDRARRFLGLADEQGMVLGQMDDLGDVFNPAAINRQRALIGGLEQRGGEAAARSLQMGAAARTAEEAAANLRAQGLQPLDVSNVVNKLRTEAAQAQYVNPPRYKLLTEFANNLEARAQAFGGVIDATGLYELRKNMGNVVADILGPTEPNALRKYTAQLIGETQPLIDDAIEAAGGKGWRDYLNSFAQGMRQVERQAFERELSKLPEPKFAEVMAGQKPKIIKKFFGPGRYDINVELMGPNLPTAQNLASDIQAGLDLKNLNTNLLSPSDASYLKTGIREEVFDAMQPGFKNVFARGLSRIAGAAPRISGGGVAAEQLEREYANKVYESVLRKLAPALAQPSEAAALLPMRATSERLGDRVAAMFPAARNILAQTARGYVTSPPMVSAPVPEEFPALDPQTGLVLVGIGETPDGQRYPMYGKPSANLNSMMRLGQ